MEIVIVGAAAGGTDAAAKARRYVAISLLFNPRIAMPNAFADSAV